ncbi:hypothetical protein JL721_8916 [Aureococcus anophagefferens]|nr:hypothetical protein JL721_8916 [Aureococcus anophagefferens]
MSAPADATNIDPASVVAVLLGTFSPVAETRKAAELQIAQLTAMRGSIFVLLRVSAEQGVQFEARQAAAIAVKNLVKKRWGDDAVFGGGEDRSRATALDALLLPSTTGAIREQLAECVNELALRDFPDRWPELVPRVMAALRAQADAASVHNALLALRKVSKRFEYKSREDGARLPLDALIGESFPLLRDMLARFVPASGAHADAAILAKLILKIFWSCTQFALPNCALRDHAFILDWFDLVKAALECDSPSPEAARGALPAGDAQALEALPQWKLKKWAAQIATRFLTRYARAKYVDAVKPFARVFARDVAPKCLESMLGLLAAASRGRYVSKRPHLDFVLFECALPTLEATLEDVDQFESDPGEFVRKSHDPMEDFFEPRAAAMSLLSDLVRSRSKDVLEKLLTRLSQTLEAYAALAPAAVTLDWARAKDGALGALGALSEDLKPRKALAAAVDRLLEVHVLPEIVAVAGAPAHCGSFGFLRSRACCGSVLRALEDAALPVRVEAASALRQLLANEHAIIERLFKPQLPNILEACFRIMADVGSDDVVQALEIVIDKFGDAIAPYAVALAAKLADAFANYASHADDDDEASMAAAQCVEAMAALLSALDDNTGNIYGAIEPHLVGPLAKIFRKDGDFVEYFENGIEVLSYLTYHGDAPFSAPLWSLFEMLIDAFHQWAYDYLPDLVAPLDNFVSRDPEAFLRGATAGGQRLVDALAGVAARLLAPEHQRRAARATASSDAPAAFECADGPPPVEEIRGREAAGNVGDDAARVVYRKSLALALLDVLNSLLFYDPRLVLDGLFDANRVPPRAAELLLTKWLAYAADAKTNLGKKLAALGFAAVLAMEPPHGAVAAALPRVFAANVAALLAIQSDSRDDVDDGDDDDDDAFDDVDDDDDEPEDADDDDDDDDVPDNIGENYGNELSAIRGALASLPDADDWDDDDDDAEGYYTSPIDHEEELLHFLRALHVAQGRGDAERWAAGLGDEQRGHLPALVQAAEEKAHQATLPTPPS